MWKQNRISAATTATFFACGVVVALVPLSVVQTVDAASLRSPPTLCSQRETGTESTPINGERTNFGTGLKYYVCPFVEFDTFTKDDVVTLSVYIHDNDTSLATYARACWHDYSGTSLSCGGWDENLPASTTGYATLSPSVATWNTSTGIAYVEVALAEDSLLEAVYAST